MFSGQGSHYYQMGLELFEGHPTFRNVMLEMDAIVGPVLQCSIIDTLYYAGKRKAEVFDNTTLTNAAIFMVEYALAKALIADDIVPDILISTSTGIFAAAAIASVINRDEALVTAAKVGMIFEAHCAKGTMVALLTDSGLYGEMDALNTRTEVAAYNFPSHFVVATPQNHLASLLRALAEKNVIFSQLAVSYAFHSKWIDDAEDAALKLFSTLRYREPQVPILCCSQTNVMEGVAPAHLWSSLRNPIQFSRTIVDLERQSHRSYIDVGPTGTLAGFLKRGLDAGSKSRVFSILTPFGNGLKNYEALKLQAASPAAASDDDPKLKPLKPAPAILSEMHFSAKDEVFVFPGQGSQKRGMGSALFDDVPEFSAREKEVDAVLGYSVRKLCLEDPDNILRQTAYTQPCLYVVNALYYYKAIAQGRRPACLAGHSLGEYNALLAAGVFDFMTGLRIVQRRGKLMAEAKNGAMAAVAGLDCAILEKILTEHDLRTLDVASFNSPRQLVVSGLEQDVRRAIPIIEKAGAQLCMPLPVSAAFHSRYMAPAAALFDRFLAEFEFGAFKVPVVSNVTAEFYASTDLRPLLVRQVVSPVHWMQSIRFLLGKGAATFSEIGPGNVLTNLVRETRASANMVPA